jgi:cytochrome c-type biogenesis protein CcmH/NrfF
MAQSVVVPPEAREAIGGLWSPYCPGRMLEVCPSPNAAALRDSIRVMAETGLSSEAIIERVLASHGEEWRAEPLRTGPGLWAWTMPFVFLAVGLGVAVTVAWIRRRRNPPHPVSPQAPSERDESRVREALAAVDVGERPDW